MILWLLPLLPGLVVLLEFVLFQQGRRLPRILFRSAELISILLLPAWFLHDFDQGETNQCCGSTAFFAPAHRTSLHVVIALCTLAYLVSSFRKRTLPPLPETVVNVLLVLGVVVNAVMALHQQDEDLDRMLALFHVPIILLFLMALVRNHRLFISEARTPEATTLLEHRCWQLLHAAPWTKFPLLLVLCVPVLALLAGVLLLFGQKPDSFIRAFTDTYRHGLSQLDHECAGVDCGGHYLCTVGARGHQAIVRPERLGVRGGRTIICTRQLLIANAFEELVQQRAPRLHRMIRRHYDRVGEQVERHYHLLDRKWVSDLVHLLMKPLEWIFLLVLYTFDGHPERRIAVQYLSVNDRRCIAEQLAEKP
ncbi:MAG: hypothetical protein JNL05_10840 [Flavobacteriales bacterium]|nr:hypothetical protein [Flavobacteriales bacterium]